MKEDAPASFQEEEATVLGWLVTRAEVAEAVDLALCGREDEALPVLTQALRSILDELGEEEPPAAAPEAANGGATEAPAATEAPEAPAESTPPPAKRQRHGASGPARCVCVLVCGLRGCGKSTMCNILREVLGGMWLNYDEFASKHPNRSEKSVRQAFAGELRGTITKSLAFSDRDQYQRLVLVDRDSTFRAHRTETLLELKRLHWRKRGGKVLLIEFVHSSDSFGYAADGQLAKRHSEQHVALCTKRIEERGAAHHTLRPSAKLRAALQKAAKESEPVSPEELMHFDGRISVDVALPPPDAAQSAIEELRSLGWLDQLKSKAELHPKVEVAWQAYRRAESQWREGVAAAAGPEPHEEWLTQCRQVLEAKKKAEELSAAVIWPKMCMMAGLWWKELVRTRAGEQPREEAPVQEQHTEESAAAAEPEASAESAPAPLSDTAQRLLQELPSMPMLLKAPEVQPAQEAEGPAEPAEPAQPVQPRPVVWRLDVPEVSKVLSQRGVLPPALQPVQNPHVSLLFLAEDGSAEGEKTGGHNGITPEQLRGAREALEALQGEEFEVRMTEIVIEENVACAIVSLPPILPCSSRVPNVALGIKPGVSRRHADTVLVELQEGKKEGVTSIKLPAPRLLKGRLSLEFSSGDGAAARG